ncbi:hypothetical protein J2Z60_001073 [Lactobacillus colini]|uniref:Uncharacterized protein n=1 Tax=Lactobacillus colini TaxID=1819254 RepID=A0ABS4ME50_9LACO|nr:hypothetical protein [Lactobacillus colini]MBP2057898.1 hypothetical protein [Lactobacillus colini]
MRLWILSLNFSTINLDRNQINKVADKVETQLRLAIHGVPWELLENASQDQLAVISEVVSRNITDDVKASANSVSYGIGQLFSQNN